MFRKLTLSTIIICLLLGTSAMAKKGEDNKQKGPEKKMEQHRQKENHAKKAKKADHYKDFDKRKAQAAKAFERWLSQLDHAHEKGDYKEVGRLIERMENFYEKMKAKHAKKFDHNKKDEYGKKEHYQKDKDKGEHGWKGKSESDKAHGPKRQGKYDKKKYAPEKRDYKTKYDQKRDFERKGKYRDERGYKGERGYDRRMHKQWDSEKDVNRYRDRDHQKRYEHRGRDRWAPEKGYRQKSRQMRRYKPAKCPFSQGKEKYRRDGEHKAQGQCPYMKQKPKEQYGPGHARDFDRQKQDHRRMARGKMMHQRRNQAYGPETQMHQRQSDRKGWRQGGHDEQFDARQEHFRDAGEYRRSGRMHQERRGNYNEPENYDRSGRRHRRGNMNNDANSQGQFPWEW